MNAEIDSSLLFNVISQLFEHRTDFRSFGFQARLAPPAAACISPEAAEAAAPASGMSLSSSENPIRSFRVMIPSTSFEPFATTRCRRPRLLL